MRGKPLRERLTETDDSARAFIQVSMTECARAIRTGTWKYGIASPDVDPSATISADSYNEAYLYERENLVSKGGDKDTRDQLRRELSEWIFEVEAVKPVIRASYPAS